MNESTQEDYLPIREIHVPDDEDNLTLPSELSNLLTYNNAQGYENHVAVGSSHHQQTHPTNPTGYSDDSHETSITRRAFQLASILALLAMCVLVYADVVVNMNSAEDAVLDQWDIDSDVPSVRGERFDAISQNNDEQEKQQKTSFWHKLRNVDAKSAKTHEKKKAKTPKKGDKSKGGDFKSDDDHTSGNQAAKNHETNSDANADETGDDAKKSSLMDDDEIIYPKKDFLFEPKLIPADAIAAATTDDSKYKIIYKPIDIPEAKKRCEYVTQTFEDQNVGVSHDFLKEKYIAQSADPNVFYRATALLFWKDFGAGNWGKEDGNNIHLEDLVLLDDAKYEDGTPLSPMSTWTWVTGDQHLSNFGAWRNRGGEVVFSVNDFDEAAIYDFHIDVLRIAVSICNHGFTNGLSIDQVSEALEAFTFKYVKTAIGYVGGDAALLYELTADTSTGVLRDFLEDVGKRKSKDKQLEKFTESGKNGLRQFSLNNDSRLEDVPIELENKIRDQMVSTKYGASMMKMGWRVRGWDDDFFQILDIARRVGSGIGSYGVDRFYVLLKGTDTSLGEDDGGDPSVILDIKYQPNSAVMQTLDEDNKSWYNHMFQNEADRTAIAQRHLTSFTDPFVGWIEIDGNPYYVRQRSPWKASFEMSDLTDPNSFVEFIEQIAIATATSHVRGSVSKSPGQFKHVIKVLLAGDRNRRRWSNLVAKIAFHYRNQVLLDYQCFKDYVKTNFQ